jgi:hypothetical protein
MPNGHDDRSGREIRLLLLVIAVAVAVLLVLARFRFPEAEIVGVTPTPNPLERIASRAPFDDLAGAVADTAARLTPLIATIEFGPPVEKSEKKNARTKAAPPAPHRFLPGLRVRPGLILVHAPAGLSPVLSNGAQVIAIDADREIALLATPAGQAGASASALDLSAGVSGFAGSTYVLVVETAAVGPAVRPVFLARTYPAAGERWNAPLLHVAGDPPATRGAFFFALDGRLIGLALPHADGLVIVDSTALDRAVAELAGGRQ